MSPTATLAQAVAPLRSEPARAAVLLDVDGTLAPIVRHAEDAHVSEATRSLLIEITRRYALVGCVSGRPAQEARQIVAIGSIAYIGNHGAELLAPGARRARAIDPALAELGARVREFARNAYDARLRALRVRFEDKGLIAAFHWRGAADEEAAESALRELAAAAEADGLWTHWGRKVLELRPPLALGKGRGIAALLEERGAAHDGERGIAAALYVGDDRTDIDAFAKLRELVEDGWLGVAVCVAVASDEAPAGLLEQADLVVDGPGAVRGLLASLLSE